LIFSFESIDELIKKITTGNYAFEELLWDEISLEAKDLICQLLNVDPDMRITAEEALCSNWIVRIFIFCDIFQDNLMIFSLNL